jgi:hypothetical protein
LLLAYKRPDLIDFHMPKREILQLVVEESLANRAESTNQTTDRLHMTAGDPTRRSQRIALAKQSED